MNTSEQEWEQAKKDHRAIVFDWGNIKIEPEPPKPAPQFDPKRLSLYWTFPKIIRGVEVFITEKLNRPRIHRIITRAKYRRR